MHDPDENTPAFEDADEGPSKSQLKRESQALRDLGKTLVELPAARLAKVPLDEDLREAIDTARRIKSHNALKRQLSYIGKLIRRADPEPIQAAVNGFQQQDQQSIRRFHALEELRDRLISEGDKALGAVLDEHPGADRQHLRQLIRQAQKDHAAQKPRGPRALFKYLRELSETGGNL